MNRTYHDSRLKFRAGVALRALALVGAGLGAAGLSSAPAFAQDYTSGAITGTVTGDDGKAVGGATVTIMSADTGTTRTATTNSSGSFRFGQLTPGSYTVKVNATGLSPWTAEDVNILASQSANLTVTLTNSSDTIVVTGKSVAAFSGTTTGLNVDVAELVKTVPLGRSLTAVTLLAPGATSGDGAFGDLASIGGSSVAENAYYLNGLNTTNFDNYLGSARVPFDFYKSVDVKSGGYAAEYGRATGGIINATTKSGTNDFTAAMHINWSPNFLVSQGKNLQFCQFDPTYTVKTCQNDTIRKADKSDSYSAVMEAGGPIIKDRLFVYGLVEFRKSTSLTHDVSSSTAYYRTNDDPFWGVKVDAYPLTSQHLEFTIFDTRNTTYRTDRGFVQDSAGNLSYSPGPTTAFHFGGVNFVGKWTGTMTDWLTLSAAYGRMRDRFDNVSDAAGTPYSANSSGIPLAGVPSGGFFTTQRSTTSEVPYTTERKFFRADADLLFTLFGDHHVRGGYDVENNTLAHYSVRTGGDVLCSSGFLTATACNAGAGGAGAALIYRPGGIVEINYYNTGGAFKARNQAFYLEDEWKIGSRLTLGLGVRRDDFKVEKADGSTLVDLKGNYAPRISATYKLWGDKSGTLKAFYGQYYLPVASNTAYRQASAEYFFRERWFYSGITSAGLPILTSQATTIGSYQGHCPFGLTPGSSGNNCNVTGDGSVPDTGAAIAHNLQATRESEWIVGYEHKVGKWTLGLTYIHRNLDKTAEDMAIDAAVLAYCSANGLTGCSNTWTGYNQYVITNPGSDVVVNLYGQDGRTVTLTAAQLGYPKAKRTYDAVQFKFDRPWDGHWSLGGSYVWSKSKGNSEGFVQSDFGQDDAGITQDFDQPGFTDYANGYLPNDRRHSFKLYGAVAFDERFSLGANAILQSPRHLSCFGYHPTDLFADGYGAASHYCGGVASPRGTAQKSDWLSQFDISARYKLKLPTGQTMTLRADVFNLFNSQAVEKRNEIGDADVDTDPVTGLPTYYYPNAGYGLPTSYQAPRSVRLGLDISF